MIKKVLQPLQDFFLLIFKTVNNPGTSTISKIVCLALSVSLLTYTILRACKLSFTHDESFTYLYASHNSFMEIISNRTAITSSNNHLLNTLFMKLFEFLFGSSEIVLRLQSILAHIAYLFLTYLLLKPLKSQLAVILGFALLNVNPYLLEFFSLARGYALAISFMLASIWFLFQYMKEDKNKTLIGCYIFASLAVLSNFALLNYFASLLIIQQVFIYAKYRSIKTNFQKSKAIILITIILAAILYEPLRKVIHQLDFGGVTGVWEDTVSSLINSYLYKVNYDFPVFKLIEGIVLITVVGYFILTGITFLKKKMPEKGPYGATFFSVLILIVTLNIVQHVLFGSAYLGERFALFLVPLFVFVLIYLMDSIYQKGKTGTIISVVLLAALTSLNLFHFSKTANLQYASNWKYDAGTKQMIGNLVHEKETSGKQHISLGITWILEPAVNFYRVTKKLDWLEKASRDGINSSNDFYYILPEDLPKLDTIRKTVLIREYPVSEGKLLK
ncbi:MAG: hypothetical protein JWP12_2506 [Bacteroidetes bacterium]|nr:hypothetical protein [Bacteroidota bacterium]